MIQNASTGTLEPCRTTLTYFPGIESLAGPGNLLPVTQLKSTRLQTAIMLFEGCRAARAARLQQLHGLHSGMQAHHWQAAA